MVHNMRLFVTATPGAGENHVEQIGPAHFVVAVRERAEKGKANTAIRKALAAYLGLSPSELTLRSGAASRHKVFIATL